VLAADPVRIRSRYRFDRQKGRPRAATYPVEREVPRDPDHPWRRELRHLGPVDVQSGECLLGNVTSVLPVTDDDERDAVGAPEEQWELSFEVVHLQPSRRERCTSRKG